MKATGISTWAGTWKKGNGFISTKSDILQKAPVSFSSRFEGTPGASPEELLAAAHAACFNQALSNIAGMSKLETESIHTVVDIDLGFAAGTGVPEIKSLHFQVSAKIPTATQAQFDDFTERARTGCTISKIIKLETTLSGTLLG